MKRLILLALFSAGCYFSHAQTLAETPRPGAAEAVCPAPSTEGIKVIKNGSCVSGPTFDVGLADYYATSPTSACSILAARNITEVEWQVYPSGSATYSIAWNTGVFYCSGLNSGFSLTFNPSDPNLPITFLFRIKNSCGQWSDWSAGFAVFKNRCGSGGME
ncbi:hypothetical protein [Chitinophaga rhizosphaerae]|uniref:hypothetical protein n=1 Tax=Chitinophaga rhizosphaerae TaxID=1864947 RepID=UPI000F81168C|nr:hypothetical protein [Chitinophaga rhizosphaerae]